ncbi:MAG: hypothetical protein WBW84_17535 [Acidobacteriaceae bacterium]
MTFDASPVAQATPVPSQPAPASGNGGMTFDASPVSSPITVSAPAGATTPAPVATMSAIPQPTTVSGKVERWAQNVADDLKYGTDLTGVGTVLKKMGAHGVYSGNPEAVGDFVASLPLGLAKVVQGAAELPQSGKRWQATKNLVSGGLQAATEPTAFVAPEETPLSKEGLLNDMAGLASKGASKAGELVGDTANAAKRPFSLKAVQEALQNSKASVQQGLQDTLTGIQQNWHQSVRDLFDSVAKEAAVQPKPAQSLNDIAANTAAAIKAKASALYRQLDQAVGGTRFQTFDEQLQNVKRALRNSAGIDPDADGRLVERVNTLEDAKAAALEQAKAAGVDPNLINEANATHRQGMALEDLSKHLRASMEGLRADVGTAATKAAPEALNPTKLSPRLNRMYNTGRLQQAIGDDHADELLEASEAAKQRAKDAASEAAQKAESAQADATRKAANVNLRRYVATAALGGIPGFELLRHLLGE